MSKATMEGSLPRMVHLILLVTLMHYAHFTDEEAKSQRDPKVVSEYQHPWDFHILQTFRVTLLLKLKFKSLWPISYPMCWTIPTSADS